MKREEAEMIAHTLLEELETHFEKYTVCGSIRRKCDAVADIDIVAIERLNAFGEPTLGQRINLIDPTGSNESQKLGKSAPARWLDGAAIKRFKYKEIMIDLYLASPETYETLILIRTGSKYHNIRLTKLAMDKGMKLKAGGEGLVSRNNEKFVYENTEDGILMKLLGRVPPPEQRN